MHSVRIDDETWDAAKAEAERRSVSVSVVVRDALRKALAGLVLLVAAVVLSGCGGTATATPAPVKAAPVKVAPVAAEKMLWHWSCALTMHITPMVGTGVTKAQMTAAMTPAVNQIRALGYKVEVDQFQPYRWNVQTATGLGQVIIAATMKADEQPGLDGNGGMTIPRVDDAKPDDELAAVILVNADPVVSELSSDLLLHELGHVLGLKHKAGTVMSEGWDDPSTFDASQVAAVSCK